MSGSSRPVVRIALVGCGTIARTVHLPTLARMDGVRVVALVDPSTDARRLASAITPGARQAASLAEALRDEPLSEAAEAVVICTPIPVLAGIAIDVFAAGRHVYVEKPLATDAASARSLRAAWQAAQRIGVVGFNYRQHPLIARAREIVQRGGIGDVVGVHGLFTSRPAIVPDWKQEKKSGGVLFDAASHHVDLVSWLVDDAPTEVSARVASRRTRDDTAVLMCRFARGAVLQGTYSRDAATDDHLTIIGTSGKIIVDRMAGLGVDVTTGPRDRAIMRRLQRTITTITSSAFARSRVVRPDAEPSFRVALERFVHDVREWPHTSHTGPASLPTIDDRLRCLSVLLAARTAAESGRWEVVHPLVDTSH